MMEQEPIPNQIYWHFKGTSYKILHVGVHSETLERVVIYQSLKDDIVWVRPVSMFTDYTKEGKKRFTLQYHPGECCVDFGGFQFKSIFDIPKETNKEWKKIEKRKPRH